MCTEPESLIPIVSTGASQVVLVGDHMQLQPIVTEHTAKQRGLARSLFERYADKAVSLTTQYRMVCSSLRFVPCVHLGLRYSHNLTTRQRLEKLLFGELNK
jgi:superfamily I DNA and/or RNA helicase